MEGLLIARNIRCFFDLKGILHLRRLRVPKHVDYEAVTRVVVGTDVPLAVAVTDPVVQSRRARNRCNPATSTTYNPAAVAERALTPVLRFHPRTPIQFVPSTVPSK